MIVYYTYFKISLNLNQIINHYHLHMIKLSFVIGNFYIRLKNKIIHYGIAPLLTNTPRSTMSFAKRGKNWYINLFLIFSLGTRLFVGVKNSNSEKRTFNRHKMFNWNPKWQKNDVIKQTENETITGRIPYQSKLWLLHHPVS